MREKKEEDQQDLLMDIQRADNETENAIEQEKATAQINGYSASVNTGNGRKRGRPNKFNTDSNGNRLGESHWDEFNKKN